MSTPGLFFALCSAWSMTWIMVMITFGSAAYMTWKQHDGTYGKALRGMIRFVSWYFDRLGGDIMAVLRNDKVEERPFNASYSEGHKLRFFIGLAAVHGGLTGAVTALADRTTWAPWVQILVLISMALSTIAAVGHLHIAWKVRPRLWRGYVMFLFLYMSIAPAIFRWVTGLY